MGSKGLRRTIRSQRKDDEHPANPINRADIPNLPIEYQQKLNGEQFLLFDSDMGDINMLQLEIRQHICFLILKLLLSDCLYHLSANIWNKIQDVGLQERYNNDQEFALHLRMIAALAFIPPGNVVNAFERLYEVIRNTYGIAVDAVLDYFKETYIGRFRRNAACGVPLFSIEMWNILHRANQEMPRSNNHIEG